MAIFNILEKCVDVHIFVYRKVIILLFNKDK